MVYYIICSQRIYQKAFLCSLCQYLFFSQYYFQKIWNQLIDGENVGLPHIAYIVIH